MNAPGDSDNMDTRLNGINLDAQIIFLDRDGVINEDSDAYVKSEAEWIPIPGSIDAIADLHRAGFRIFVVTNQSGLARGYFDHATLTAMHRKMQQLVKQAGGEIADEDIYFCPHGPNDHCPCRKPLPGMLQQAAANNGFELTNLPMVGDSLRDIECAQAADAKGILVRTGKGERTLAKHQQDHSGPLADVPVFNNLGEVAKAILLSL